LSKETPQIIRALRDANPNRTESYLPFFLVGGLWGKFDLGEVALGLPLAETEFVETAFMNIVWDLLIVAGVLIALTIMLSLRFEQRRWDKEREQELQDFNQ
jgi:hypothetical protein